jgi:hypothetical protein
VILFRRADFDHASQTYVQTGHVYNTDNSRRKMNEGDNGVRVYAVGLLINSHFRQVVPFYGAPGA